MNFDFNDEQKMLKDSVARFVQEQYDFEARTRFIAEPQGFSSANWQTFAELGWLSIPFAEEYGGFGGGAVDTMAVMEELGRGLVAEPFVASVIMFGSLLSQSNDDELKRNLISQLIDGSLLGAVAYLEPQGRYELSDIKTSAVQQGDAWVLNGEKSLVLNGASANKLIVSARSAGEQADEAGISLFIIDADAEGVARTELRLMDGQKVANVTLNNVIAQPVSAIGQGFAALKTMSLEATVALCGEALGNMQKLNATTIEYAKTRQQFGVAIGSFQALQHRMVDMFMACEQVKSLLYRTVCSMDEGENNAEVERNICALKVMVGRAGKHIGGEAIQMHGGMGMTEELDVGHYARRLLMINHSFGDVDFQQQKFIELSE